MHDSRNAKYQKPTRDVKSEFGHRLEALIQQAGYRTIAAFCLEKRYRSAQVYVWIHGGHEPRLDVIRRLAQDLNVTAGYLAFGEEPIPAPQRSVPQLPPGGIMSTARKPPAAVGRRRFPRLARAS